jgi:hypothetical protein
MRPVSTVPVASALALLPGAPFADAFCIDVDEPGLDAIAAADRVFRTAPPWIGRLLAMRNAVMRLFGIKSTRNAYRLATDRIGVFPCVSRSAERVVLGFDDKHLDFRIAVDAAAATQGRRITATTIVKPHNLLGRIYLFVIMPFHKLIVRTLLGQLNWPDSRSTR